MEDWTKDTLEGYSGGYCQGRKQPLYGRVAELCRNSRPRWQCAADVTFSDTNTWIPSVYDLWRIVNTDNQGRRSWPYDQKAAQKTNNVFSWGGRCSESRHRPCHDVGLGVKHVNARLCHRANHGAPLSRFRPARTIVSAFPREPRPRWRKWETGKIVALSRLPSC